MRRITWIGVWVATVSLMGCATKSDPITIFLQDYGIPECYIGMKQADFIERNQEQIRETETFDKSSRYFLKNGGVVEIEWSWNRVAQITVWRDESKPTGYIKITREEDIIIANLAEEDLKIFEPMPKKN